MANQNQQQNQGAVALRRTGKTEAEIGRVLGVSKVMAHYYLSSEKRPGAEKRRIAREQLGVGEELWDLPVERKALPTVEPTAAVVGGPFAMARELEQQAIELMRSLREGGGAPIEKARVMASLAATINTLAKITGEYDLGRRMTQLPLWKRSVRELEEALRPFPDAARAVRERFEAIAREVEG